MSTIENTANRNYPMVVGTNNIAEDFERLRQLAVMLDIDIAQLLSAVAAKVSLADLLAYQARSERGQANGYCPLDANGAIPASYLPASVFGALTYKGGWNASLNLPPMPVAKTANKGWYYVVTVAGSTSLGGVNDWMVGDWLVSDGSNWCKVDNSDRVSSVAGKTGVVTLQKADITDFGHRHGAGDLDGLGSAAFLPAGIGPNKVLQLDQSGNIPAMSSENLYGNNLVRSFGSFNGLTGAIYFGFNLYSVRRIAVGRYLVDFTNHMPSLGYVVTTMISTGDNPSAMSVHHKAGIKERWGFELQVTHSTSENHGYADFIEIGFQVVGL